MPEPKPRRRVPRRRVPLRGTAGGLMPTAQEAVDAFPGRELLIDLKNDDPADGSRLADYLATLPTARLTTISVYGGDDAVDAVRSRYRDASQRVTFLLVERLQHGRPNTVGMLPCRSRSNVGSGRLRR